MYIYPAHLFNPAEISAGVVENVISGGRSLSGIEDVIATDGGGRWRVTYSGITLRTPQMLRKWEAWVSHLAGGARSVLVPLVSVYTAPRPIAGGRLAKPSSLYADDPYFPTEVRPASPYIVATTIGDAPLRATSLTISVAQGARIEGGERFSIAGRAHRVERVVSRSGQVATCLVSPPTRGGIASGMPVNFEWPTVQCRAAPGQDLNPPLEYGRIGAASITFMEDFSDAG